MIIGTKLENQEKEQSNQQRTSLQNQNSNSQKESSTKIQKFRIQKTSSQQQNKTQTDFLYQEHFEKPMQITTHTNFNEIEKSQKQWTQTEFQDTISKIKIEMINTSVQTDEIPPVENFELYIFIILVTLQVIEQFKNTCQLNIYQHSQRINLNELLCLQLISINIPQIQQINNILVSNLLMNFYKGLLQNFDKEQQILSIKLTNNSKENLLQKIKILTLQRDKLISQNEEKDIELNLVREQNLKLHQQIYDQSQKRKQPIDEPFNFQL